MWQVPTAPAIPFILARQQQLSNQGISKTMAIVEFPLLEQATHVTTLLTGHIIHESGHDRS